MRRFRTRRDRRRAKTRAKTKGTATHPRLVVTRSNRYTYAQLIDDEEGKTLVACDSRSWSKSGGRKLTKTEQARSVGKEIAKRAQKLGIKTIVFDRAGYKYHGRVRALAEGAREEGLKF